jgi:hypothetical protein
VGSSPSSEFRPAFFVRHPNLRVEGFEETSPRDENYNCVAWALGRTDRWFEPGGFQGTYWPLGVRQDTSIDAYIELFETFGYERAETPGHEEGFERVALDGDAGEFMHVAVQVAHGWSSKCGALQDIAHTTLRALEDDVYGEVVAVLRRSLM